MGRCIILSGEHPRWGDISVPEEASQAVREAERGEGWRGCRRSGACMGCSLKLRRKLR